MSDTPRTDKEVAVTKKYTANYEDPKDAHFENYQHIRDVCRMIERELNAANKRIAELDAQINEALNDERLNQP